MFCRTLILVALAAGIGKAQGQGAVKVIRSDASEFGIAPGRSLCWVRTSSVSFRIVNFRQ